MLIAHDDPTRPWDDEGVFEVSSGVYRVPLPMPNDALRAVNVYAIDSADGVVLIDGGVATKVSRDRLRSALESLGYSFEDITRILVTHIHYDHYSQAVALRDDFRTRVSVGRMEKPSIEVMTDPSIPPLARQVSLLQEYGATDLADEILDYRDDVRNQRPPTGPPTDWLDEGTEFSVGSRTFRSIHTPGHTQGHMVFMDAANGLLFAGDHVLPHITPSIGFEPVPGKLPLGDYLRSLELLRSRPDARLLPAHGPVREGFHDRIDELLSHHDDRLGSALAAVGSDVSSGQAIAERLRWTRRRRRFTELDVFNRMLAVLETGAHLDLLVAQGRLAVTTSDGIRHYESN